MFEGRKDGERIVYVAKPQAYNELQLERKTWDVVEGDQPELTIAVLEEDTVIKLGINQEQALDLARLLKEFGVRGVLPEPPVPPPVAEPEAPQLPMAAQE